MTKPKVIVVWGNEAILSTSIGLFLAAMEGWKVACLSNQDDLAALALEVENSASDFVIILQGHVDNPGMLPLQVLQEHPAIKVITIDLENNLIDIYDKQRILVEQASDLIAVIENAPRPYR